MRRCLAVLIAVFLLPSSLWAQPGRNHLLRHYDELEACTTVNADVFTLSPRRGRNLVELDAFAMHRGTAPAEPFREVTFRLTVEHGADSDTLGLDDPRLTLVLDDSARLSYRGRPARSFPARHVRGGVLDRMHFRVPVADLRRIAHAAKVEGRVGMVGFTLGPRRLGVLRQLADFVARSPRAPTPRRGDFDWTDCDSFPWSPNHPSYQPEDGS